MSFPASMLKMLPDAAAQGLIWGILAIGVFITYKLLDFSDLTVDGSICTGGAVAALLILNGVPAALAMAAAFCAGALAGLLTAILHTRMGIPPILSGILTQLALYSINLRIMGKSMLADTFPTRGVNPEPHTAPGSRPTLYVSVGLVATLLGLGFVLGHEQGLLCHGVGLSPKTERRLPILFRLARTGALHVRPRI